MASEKTDDSIKCPICNDYLADPTTLPCGHNFCLKCISHEWDNQPYHGQYRCPKCFKTLPARPELTTNESLAVMVSRLKHLKIKENIQDCMNAKIKKDAVQVRRPVKRDNSRAKEILRERCFPHQKKFSFYCSDDKKWICELCTLSDHRGHNVVSAEEERNDKEQQLREFLQKAKDELQERKRSLQKTIKVLEHVKGSSKPALEDTERKLTELTKKLEKMKKELKEIVQEQEKILVSQAELEKQQQELAITSLQAKITALEALSHEKEDVLFVMKLQSTASQNETIPVTVNFNENLSFEIMKFASTVITTMEEVCETAVEGIKKKVRSMQLVETSEAKQAMTSLARPVRSPIQLQMRTDFLQYACPLTLDSNTAHPSLIITSDDKKVLVCNKRRKIKSSPGRFDCWEQVLCKEELTGGRFYWEVEWTGKGVFIGVAQDDMIRKGDGKECGLGHNVSSWCLQCSNVGYFAWHDDITITTMVNVYSPRIGIYLDWKASTLAFYSISHKMFHIYTFILKNVSRPLYPAFGLGLGLGLQSSVKLCKLDEQNTE